MSSEPSSYWSRHAGTELRTCANVCACELPLSSADSRCVFAARQQIGLVLILFAQLRYLARFYRDRHEVAWAPSDPPSSYSDVEDPLLALLVRVRLLRPRNREQGGFEAPEDDPEAEEPHRTEDALGKAFRCFMGPSLLTSTGAASHIQSLWIHEEGVVHSREG